ncbi:MAG: hypothetical protein IJ477_03700, partial [Alistipes sp.]|nr:hypothetical protein [Alistipes sp.]
MTGTGNSVTLNCEEPVAISDSSESPTEFWVVLPPVTFAEGFTLTVENAEGEAQVYEVDSKIEFKRNQYKTLTREFSPEFLVAQPDQWDGKTRGEMIYEVLVYAFADSDGDGMGDFNGVTQKMDYIASLGAGAIWLSPIHPADSYHGYDVTDYT